MTKRALPVGIMMVAILAIGFGGCASGRVEVVEEFEDVFSFSMGSTHTCTLQCTNVVTGNTQVVLRLGRDVNDIAVCKDNRLVCKAGRSAACTNATNAVNKNEPLFENCVAVALGTCAQTCLQAL